MNAPVAIQDRYPDEFAVCYGCGRHNAHGLHVRTFLEGNEGVARFTPRAEHTAVPGFVYGGLLASLIDCHGIGTAAAIMERVADTTSRTQADAPDAPPATPTGSTARPATDAPRFVTGSLQVVYLAPTPLGPELELRARVVETSERKAVVDVTVRANGQTTVTGRVVAVRLPQSMERG